MVDGQQGSAEQVIRQARPDRPDEVARLYDICLRTADAGQDGTGLIEDPRLLGDVYVGPYLEHSADLCWVLARADELPIGYILGVADTDDFEARLEREWWPRVREDLASRPAPRSAGGVRLRAVVESPRRTPREVTAAYPAHLHIDLLPQAQGGGNGGRLMGTLLDALRARGVPGVHLGVSTINTNAVGFYRHLGFGVLVEELDALTLGLRLEP